MHSFYSPFMYAFASLFAMINPIGMSSVFLAMTQNCAAERRHKLAYKVAMYGAIFLICSYFIGPFILSFFGISLPYIEVSGGIVVFFSAWAMLNAKSKASAEEHKEAAGDQQDIAFFPLTMPLTTGAGSLAVIIALAARYASYQNFSLVGTLSAMAAIIVVMLTVALCYRFSDIIFNKLGHTGTDVISRLSAFILLAIGVDVIWQGILQLIQPLIH
jgi:multiple antibiotic resistance protein